MPIDRSAIERQLEALGEGSHWWEQREFRDLPAALHADEQVLAIALAKLNRPRWLRRPWLIVVTNARLLCLQSGRRMRRRQLEVSVKQITRVSMRQGPFRARVMIAVAGDKYGLLLHRADAFKLLAALSSVVQSRDSTLQGARPGMMFGRVIRHVLELPTVALQPDPKPGTTPQPRAPELSEKRLEALEEQIQQLQQQVDFLEKLLHERSLR